MRGYYFITDSGLSVAGNAADVACAISCGVEVVQYREKSMETGAMFREALALCEMCRAGHVKFIVNDRIDIALAVDADGVHLGQDDMPYHAARRILGSGRIIGISVHTVEQALEAERGGADYLGAGPVYATATKHDAEAPHGLGLVHEIKKHCHVPVVAIGGIDLSNAAHVIRAGADMVCAISAVVTRDNAAAEIKKFMRLF